MNIFSGLKELLPVRSRGLFRDIIGTNELERRLDHLSICLYQILENNNQLSERARQRWIEAAPTSYLTWGKWLSGDDFVKKADRYGAFADEYTILELGSGYGRILESILILEKPFKSYTGVDISAKNIQFLRDNYKLENIHFLQDNFETIVLDSTFNVILSSLTIKHLYPTFEKAICNVVNYLDKDGLLLFDLIEGTRRYFQEDEITYIKYYSRQEIIEILEKAGLESISFDKVVHDRLHIRLLVVARKI